LQVARDQVLDEINAPAFDKDLTHVRDIEHPGRLADGVMLVHDARVLHGELQP